MPPTSAAQTTEFAAFAHALADASRAVIAPLFRRATANDKSGGGPFDPVTEADRGAERKLRELIGAAYPDHGIVGEEYGAHNPDAAHCWVIDPIDGTRAFIAGLPVWGTLIGLMAEGRPLIGLMDQPFTRERFWSDGAGAFYRLGDGPTERMSTRGCARLENAVLACTTPEMFRTNEEQAGFAAMQARARLTRFGGDCYNYCMLAMGLIDVVVEAQLKSFDIVALTPIIEAAGGRVSTWEGGAPAEGGRIVAAANPALHAAALEVLQAA
ncbi:histidinol-phosphatase [Dichotomicrobium thermohalophilum]|uniref:Histidinol-phosphatase n=1 Tax=Dichotomicrobium thermohalophilum TaxID=933063 RepID=A0A397Q561_9HYPH|nr:histidinol-phosphatase [Dichotomicrobium thermohalophilum]RIA56242.1 myo-inositol-1(or 4)-monophosphatase [Dichotomicrobium thermohalophilum]